MEQSLSILHSDIFGSFDIFELEFEAFGSSFAEAVWEAAFSLLSTTEGPFDNFELEVFVSSFSEAVSEATFSLLSSTEDSFVTKFLPVSGFASAIKYSLKGS